MIPNTYEVKDTNTGTGCGYMPDFPTLRRALKNAKSQHGAITCTYDEAVSIVKQHGIKVAIHVRHEAPSRSTPGYGRSVHGSVWVRRKDALDFLGGGYRHAKDKVLVEMSLHGNAIFIG